MGEMADFALEEMLDDWEARTEYRIGYMDLVEALDRGVVNEFGEEDGE